MANLKVFVSSTCYDMQAIRAQLRSLLLSFGYEPVMSDQADVIYDPRIHTHTSCLREVSNCDVVVLVVGSRFGGATVPKALETIDLDRLTDLSRADRFGEDKTRISITQAEVLQAIQMRVPVFAFVDSGVMRDHLTYEKNKNKPIIGQIEFSSIDKADTAPYIFEFINFLRLRNENNSIFEFARFEDLENQLKKQWAGLFQRLLNEQREKGLETRRIDHLTSQIADLKAAVLSSIPNDNLKATAKGAIRFRTMLDLIHSIAMIECPNEVDNLIHSQFTWDELLKHLSIVNVIPDGSRDRIGIGMAVILIKNDGTYFRARLPIRSISRFSREWNEFKGHSSESKNAILAAILDSQESRISPLIRYYNEVYVEERAVPRSEDDEVGGDGFKPAEVLLTQERYIEVSLQTYVRTVPAFQNFRFMISAKSDAVEVGVSTPDVPNEMRTINLNYSAPSDGNLSGTIEELKSRLVLEVSNLIDEKLKAKPPIKRQQVKRSRTKTAKAT